MQYDLIIDWLTRILVASIMGFAVGTSYARFYQGFFYSRTFVPTCVLTVLLCALIAGIVADAASRYGQALAFALIGMLGLIRFRTVVRDTREFTYMFVAIVTGVAIGSGEIAVGTFGCAFALLLLSFLDWSGIGSPAATSMRIKVRTTSSDVATLTEQLNTICTRVDLVVIRKGEDGRYVLSYDAITRRGHSMSNVLDSLAGTTGVVDVAVNRWSTTRATAEEDS